MTISIGAATDALYALAQQAVNGVTVNGAAAVAVDGWPYDLQPGMFVIGLSQPPPDGLAETTGIGLRLLGINQAVFDEDYTIPCYIDVRIGGTGTTQKTARDQALAIFSTFFAAFVADLTLAGAIRGPASVTALTATPANVGTAAEPGKRQFISFGVRCPNDITV